MSESVDRSRYWRNEPRYSPAEIRGGLSLFKLISGNAVMVGDPNFDKSPVELALENPGSVVTDLGTQYGMMLANPNIFSPVATVEQTEPPVEPSRFGVEPNKSAIDTFFGRYRPDEDDRYDQLTTEFLEALDIKKGSAVHIHFGIKPKSGLDQSVHSRDLAFVEDKAVIQIDTTPGYRLEVGGVLGEMTLGLAIAVPITPEFADDQRGIIFNEKDGYVENTGVAMRHTPEIRDFERKKPATNIVLALIRNTLFEKHRIVAHAPDDRRATR